MCRDKRENAHCNYTPVDFLEQNRGKGPMETTPHKVLKVVSGGVVQKFKINLKYIKPHQNKKTAPKRKKDDHKTARKTAPRKPTKKTALCAFFTYPLLC